ncbi:MAG: hypothetical protein ACLFQP_04585 [Halothece sp.]
MKSVVIATIGTRDLMFQVTSGKWFNIGDDRMQDGDIIGEQAEVLSDLGLPSSSYRELTQYLLEHHSLYLERIKPVIIGGLLGDRISDIERIYLIGTDQKPDIREREKDTLHSCNLIQRWVESQLNTDIAVETILVGQDGTNPSNFEEMFRWWREVWCDRIQVKENQPIWLCLKGGVGQAAEAGRISGLSRYGDRIQFFEFARTPRKNQDGIPSEYSGPFLGTNYLWDRTQQQSLALLNRYDYDALGNLLTNYWKQDPEGFKIIKPLVKAGKLWNQGQFEQFFAEAKGSLTLQQKEQTHEYWWKAYEEAYLAVVRLEQKNTVEAMFHSFRAIEALTKDWVVVTFPNAVKPHPNKFPSLHRSICQEFSNNQRLANLFGSNETIELSRWSLQVLTEAAIPQMRNNADFRPFWKTAGDLRNQLAHTIYGLPPQDLFKAWQVSNQQQWEKRILHCLNLITQQSFSSLLQPSLFASTHYRLKGLIPNYTP